ncbi:hypothetical protein C8F04DRAFT_1282418 [Mycena alexandri]|uniref:DUF6589 domain-containing protein n=1 Tax=Mycena alexandri TaxID=1745969 RepID=A0AAD6RWM3_9AGAR|nr:hypothetical protein C8F04DRAFT_1282418 [Mycena alexandri]
MSRRAANRYTILSSDADDPPDDNDDHLPPSDEPEHSGESGSDSESDTPIRPLPALTSLLAPLPNSSPPPHPTSDDILFTPRTEKHLLRQRTEQQRQASRLENRTQKKTTAELNMERAARQAALEAEKQKLRHIQVFDKFLAEMKTNDISLAEFFEHVFDPETKLNSDWRWRGFFAHQNIARRIFGYWTSSKYNHSTRDFMHDWALEHVAKTASTEARAITHSGVLNKTKKVINEHFFLDFSLREITRTIRGMAPTMFRVFDSFSSTTRQLRKASAQFLEKKELMKGAAALTLLRGASQNNNYAQAVNGMYLAATGGQRQHFPVLGIYGFSVGYTSIISSRAKTAKDATPAPLGDLNDVDVVSPSAPTPANAARRKKKKKKQKKKTGKAAESSTLPSGDPSDIDDVSPSTPTPAGAPDKNRPPKYTGIKRKRVREPGLFSFLRDACMATNQTLAHSHLVGYVYDNVNLMNRIAEAILGRKSAQENGTCATIFPLHKAKLEHMKTTDLDGSILSAPALTLDHIVLNAADSDFLTQNMVHTILRIIVGHGGEGFEKWRKDLDASQPISGDVIEVHKTTLHPLPAMEIDESSITGNVEVIEEIMRVLGFKRDDPDYGKYVQILGGDQLTIARQRSILNIRLGHESGTHSWKHIVLMPGLFHAKIADCHGLLETHFGKPSAGARSPGSLGFHNTVLDRLPITLTSLPPFRTCRDLIMVSLYARVLHCLLLVSGHDSLDKYAASVTSWDVVVSHAQKIHQTYTDVDRVQELREHRIPEERKRDADAKTAKKGQPTLPESKTHLPHVKKGDMVFENAILFMRDALLTREFADAIKSGDSGRIVIILRLWAFSYRGSGRTKYAHEMLHVLHNILCVWTSELRSIILQNWVANPQGKRNGFVEIDLVQEHLNFWIKKVYKADGAGHSWDWLAMVSPCIDILRQLATRINGELGARQGSKHATPDLEDDINVLMASLDEHEVYVEKEGRVLDDDESPAPDVVSVGMAALTHGTSTTPLADFNQQFDILRERRRLTPVADLFGLVNASGLSRAPVSDSVPTTDNEGSHAMDDDDFADLPDLVESEDSDEEPEAADYEEDLFAESPTLTRLDEGDVDLDKDEVPEWDLDDGDYYGSDSDYEDSGEDDNDE